MIENTDKTELHNLFRAGPLQKPADVVGFAIWRLSLAYQRRVELSLRGMGLTHTQFAILSLSAWLNHTQALVNHRDVAKLSGVQVAQVSHMVKALRAKKLVAQRAGTEDTRVRYITVTAAGIRLLAKAIPMMSKLQAELWPSGAESGDLLRIIDKTVERWDKKDE